MTNSEGKEKGQVAFPGARIKTQSQQRPVGPGVLGTPLLKPLTAPSDVLEPLGA